MKTAMMVALLTLVPGAALAQAPSAEEVRLHQDWAWQAKYRDANAQIRAQNQRPTIVFMGDSITEGWVGKVPDFFTAGRIGRGIGGQTSTQMLVRFRADVIDLRPQIVQIMAGTNDIAGNTGPMTAEQTKENLMSMAELARANGIRVILASIPPADHFPWRPGLATGPKIVALNAWMKDYAQRTGAIYADYWTALHDGEGMRAGFAYDGVHPTEAGYAAMQPVAEAAIRAALAAPGPVVASDDGPVRGEAVGPRGGVFRGIRFAAPPVGALRWAPPVRPQPWTAPVDTTAEHAACPQPAYGDWNAKAAAASAEDCLFLDVRSPDLKGKRPVLVWIHGGGNRAGAGGGTVESRIGDGAIVVVSIQYRLGALGFLSHPALSREQGGTSGNYALMDQQAALQWVRRNIAKFGGNPAKVTIAGESAGAQDVGLHLLMPGSRGLFRGAIEESGTPGFGTPPRSLAQNSALGELIAAKAGAARATAADLRALPLASIIAAQETLDVPGLDDDSFVWLQVVVDGKVVPDTPARLLATGRINPAAVVIGVNAKELGLHGGRAAAEPTVRREFGANAVRALDFYGLQPGGKPANDPRLGDVTLQIANDVTFRCPTVAVSKALSRHGQRVWQYHFDFGPDVSHASETGYVFGAPPAALPIQRYWVNFVVQGDPNGPALPGWPRYDAAKRGYLAFTDSGAVAMAGLRDPICALRNAP